jgi:glucosamine--fructose-6-phosphate aminotransferase (isomerizing)
VLKDQKSMFLLGSGHAFPICKEGALLIKEVSKTHAEAYPGGALKHGPFALLE